MRRAFALPLAGLLFAPAAFAADIEVDLDNIGPRWLGPNYRDNFGWNVQSIGDLNNDGLPDFAVSAPQDQGPTTFDSVVRIYFGRSGGPPPEGFGDWADVEIGDDETVEDAVFEYALVPDADGDGNPDVLVTEPFWTDAKAGKYGRALLYRGGGSSWPAALQPRDAIAIWTGFEQDEFPDQLDPRTAPSAVAGGDLDGDGLTDIVIASELFQRVWVDYSRDGFEAEQSLASVAWHYTACTDEFPATQFAEDIAVGDLNGDDIDDLVVAAPGCNDRAGRLFVWFGRNGSLASQPDFVIQGGDRLGGALFIGDLNDDGFGDLFAQELQSGDNVDKGNLWIFLGSEAGLPASPSIVVEAGFSDRRFGEAVALLPDVSNPPDGRPELVVGSPEGFDSERGQGMLYIFEGRAEWPDAMSVNDAKYLVAGSHGGSSPQLGSWFGASIAAVGDWDGNGFPELVVGEPNFTDGASENDYQRGRFYLFSALPDRDEDGDLSSTLNGDCDDTDPNVRPGGLEQCDGIDNNCNHTVDEGCGDDDDDDTVGDDDDGTPDIGDDDDCTCSSSVVGEADEHGPVLGLVALLGLSLTVRRRRAARP